MSSEITTQSIAQFREGTATSQNAVVRRAVTKMVLTMQVTIKRLLMPTCQPCH